MPSRGESSFSQAVGGAISPIWARRTNLLARSAGAIVSREELSLSVNGRHSDPFDRSIDMHVCNLRKKLGPGAAGAERIRSVRGVGYFLARVTGE